MSTSPRPNATTTENSRPLPQLPSVTPHLVCKGAADAIEFYKRAFNATELVRMPLPDGKIMHACIRIGNSPVMLVDEMPEMACLGPKSLNGTPVTIHLMVENADTFAEQAVKAGATTIMPVADMFWGDRYGVVEDPFGHRWSIAHRVRQVSPEEAMRAAAEFMGPDGKCA